MPRTEACVRSGRAFDGFWRVRQHACLPSFVATDTVAERYPAVSGELVPKDLMCANLPNSLECTLGKSVCTWPRNIIAPTWTPFVIICSARWGRESHSSTWWLRCSAGRHHSSTRLQRICSKEQDGVGIFRIVSQTDPRKACIRQGGRRH
jgi:hypothetical protein